MTLRIPDGFFQIVLHHALDGHTKDMICTLGVELEEGAGGVSGPVAAQTVGDAWVEHVMPRLSAQLRLTGVQALTEDGVVGEVAFNAPGTDVTPISPPSVAHLVKKVTATPGRRHTGRLFIPAVPEGQVDNAGTLTAAHRAGMNTALGSFNAEFANFVGITALVLLHNYVEVNGAPAADQPAPDRITELICDSRVATQRRRLR